MKNLAPFRMKNIELTCNANQREHDIQTVKINVLEGNAEKTLVYQWPSVRRRDNPKAPIDIDYFSGDFDESIPGMKIIQEKDPE